MPDGRAAGRIQALVFDAYGTLFDVHSVVSACDELFPAQGQALSQLWRAKQLEYSWLLSLMERYEDFWQVTERALTFACDALSLSLHEVARARLLDCYLHLDTYPDVLPGLRALSSFRLAILSNGSPRMLDAVVQSAGLAGVFAEVISVDEVRIYKPSRRVYELAPRKLRMGATSIGFVSANPFDVAGAKAFGLWTCWLNRQHAVPDALGLAPDVTAHTLADLRGLLPPPAQIAGHGA